MSLLCIIAAVVAFTLFGLSTDAHHRRRFGAVPSSGMRRTLRWGAWAAVAACCTLAFSAKGAVFGTVFSLGALMIGAAAVFLVLNLAPASSPRTPARTDQ